MFRGKGEVLLDYLERHRPHLALLTHLSAVVDDTLKEIFWKDHNLGPLRFRSLHHLDHSDQIKIKGWERRGRGLLPQGWRSRMCREWT